MEIENFETVTEGLCIAKFTVYLPEYKQRIHNCRVVNKKSGGYFFTMPQYCKERNGKKEWFPIIEFSKEKAEELIKQTYETLKIFVK